MSYIYRIQRLLPRIFCLALLVFALPAQAESVQILPQFHAYKSPRELPNIRFKDTKGNARSIADYRGQWVLINVWATWCAPCRKEMPQLDSLQEAFEDTNFRILPISIDSPQTASKIPGFYREHEIKYLPMLNDDSASVMRTLSPRGLPMSWLIDPRGNAVGEVSGYARWDSEAAGNLIEHYLQKQ